MAIGAQQAAIRTVLASALAELAGESGRSVDALFAIRQAGSRAGRLRNQASDLSCGQSRLGYQALAIMTNVRSQMLPDVPTMAEAGCSGIEGEEWHGVVAPTGTPKDIIALLNRETVRSPLRAEAASSMLSPSA
jgi:hypothetical protein